MTRRIPESQTDHELPMVVYLRGDEDFAAEFQFDAEDAMNFLGIKRSRLTQISGRELRVGRIRRDRYIRPVYRQKDLEDYQSWTRSTATHQSSSLMIEQAIKRLEQQCQQLEETALGPYQENLQAAVSEFLAEVNRMGSQLASQLAEQKRWLKRQIGQQPDLWFRLQEPIENFSRSIARIEERLQKDFGHIQEIQAAFHQNLGELLAQVKRLPGKLDDFVENIHNAWQESLQQQHELWSKVEGLHKVQMQHWRDHQAQLMSRLDELALPSTPSRPRRQVPLRQRRQLRVFGGRSLD